MDAVMPRHADVRARNHLGTLARAAVRAATQTLLGLVFLADTARWTVDAIGRTITRVFVTRRHLLEWVTAARAETQPVPGIAGSYRRMAVGVGASGVLAAPRSPCGPRPGRSSRRSRWRGSPRRPSRRGSAARSARNGSRRRRRPTPTRCASSRGARGATSRRS
jgi:hypothetical protein